MSQDMRGLDITLRAGANINTTTADFRAVQIGSAMSALICASMTSKPIGVLQNRPKDNTGASCQVRVAGVTKLYLNDTCTAGDLIGIYTSGTAMRLVGVSVTGATIGSVLGRALEASAITGTVISLLLMPYTIPGSLTVTFE